MTNEMNVLPSASKARSDVGEVIANQGSKAFVGFRKLVIISIQTAIENCEYQAIVDFDPNDVPAGVIHRLRDELIGKGYIVIKESFSGQQNPRLRISWEDEEW